jgi:tetratricopeptide (TPR) repeat protein
MAGAGSGWRIAIMRPGSDPIGNLALALADKDVLLEAGAGLPPAEAEAVIEATLRRGSLGLVEVARQARLAANEKLLVVVDQFEELFRFRAARSLSSTADDASAFVKLLLEAAQQKELSIYVVPTMRSDFLGDCAQFQGLPEAINDGQYLIPRMTRDERRFAITGPVGVTRGKISEPLVSRLMNDVGDNPDQLPILQHALMRTWDYWATQRRNGDPIGIEHYEAVGTMSDALSEHADEAFNELPDARSRQLAEVLFKALTERGADNREIRRPTCLRDICDIANASAAEMIAVIEVFRAAGRSFLMPPAGGPLRPETVIDISHESLIRNWRRLKEWVKDEAESARIYRRLAGAAMDYKQGAGGLLDDVTLQYVLKWRDTAKPDPAWGARYHPAFANAMSYLEESRTARDTRIAAEEERERRELETARAFAEKQARSAHRMRRLTAALGVILLFALGTTAYAVVMGVKAKRSERRTLTLVGDLAASQLKVAQEKTAAANAQRNADEKERIALAEERNAAEAKADAARATAAATEARKQAAIDKQLAADNLVKARVATAKAEAKEKEIKEAGDRDDLLRNSIQATRRDDPEDALQYLKKLKNQLESAAASSTNSNSTRFVKELGWTLSDIGSIHQQLQEFDQAIDNYKLALVKLNQVLPPHSDDAILFGTYHGLGHSHHDAAMQLGRPGSDADKEEEKVQLAAFNEHLKDAEIYYKKALDFQTEHRANKPSEIAGGHLNLARLYTDLGDDAAAKQNYEMAVSLMNGKKPDEVDAVRRELGQFLSNAGRYAEAADIYNDLITSQEDITVSEFADKGQAIANFYSELADIYRAEAAAAKADAAQATTPAAAATAARKQREKEDAADNVFEVADLIQKVSLKLKRNAKLTESGNPGVPVDLKIDDDLDEMGDAYVKLKKFSDAEVIYKEALALRQESPQKNQFLWKSYGKLTSLYRDNLKNDPAAEEYNRLLVESLKDNKGGSNLYLDSLVRLAALHAKDPTRYAEAEALYKQGLDIAAAQDDWQYPNLIHYQLAELYGKQRRGPEREQAMMRRLEVLTKYFNRLNGPAAHRPKASFTLVSEYLNAIEGVAFLQSTVNKNDVQAEATFKLVVDAYEPITQNIYNAKTLESYAKTLDRYQVWLTKLNKADQALRVKEKADELRGKVLPQLNQIYTQNQQGPGTSPTAP